jgi:hypothetical protein
MIQKELSSSFFFSFIDMECLSSRSTKSQLTGTAISLFLVNVYYGTYLEPKLLLKFWMPLERTLNISYWVLMSSEENS